jgi:D-lactate dehydrogenase
MVPTMTSQPTDDEISWLRRTSPFDAASAATLHRLAQAARRVDLTAGSYAFHKGEASPWIFLILAGSFEASSTAEDGRTVVLRRFVPGDLGGLTSVDGSLTRSASLRALDDNAALLVLDKAVIRDCLRDDDGLDTALIAYLGRRLRAKTAQLATLIARTTRDPREKIAFFDSKSYDRESFSRHLGDDLRARWLDARLELPTAALAEGFPIVCAFVNDRLDEPVLERLAAGGTGMIALRCAGYNNVDLAAAARLGLEVVRVPAYSPHAVAEHAVALILALNRKIHRAHARIREGNFSLTGLVGFDLHGRTAGIIGLGKIGRCLAEILRGFGMRVLASDALPDLAYATRNGIEYVPLEDLISGSDIISLHAPLTPETYHLIDAGRIAAMKRGAMVINTSRGGLVDASALIAGLKSGQLGAAGLDVYEEESQYFFRDRSDDVITDDVLARLTTFHNVLITSHQAFLTEDALGNIATTTMASIALWLSGARGPALLHRVIAP